MFSLDNIKHKRVFEIFSEMAEIPHGSGNMEKISDYCVSFAEKNGLKCVKDSAFNVIIYKDATVGYENSEPIILQGHLDMVCQAEEGYKIDFLSEGLKLYREDDLIKAVGTTLGADDGIAVAMVMAILEDKTLSHPKIEAVFTTDEEIGMLGATALDASYLTAKRMINIDSGEENIITASCAGGIDFSVKLPFVYEKNNEKEIEVTLVGLKGGHSGVEIDKGRVNADTLLGRILNRLNLSFEIRLVSVSGGDKGNAIPKSAKAVFKTKQPEKAITILNEYLSSIKSEISAAEPDFDYRVEYATSDNDFCMDKKSSDSIIFALCATPQGVMEFSSEIEDLVETSLNLGILKTGDNAVYLNYALRSNKASALEGLTEKMKAFYSTVECETETSGFYPPWEFRKNSVFREIYANTYNELFNEMPQINAIHAGLECAVFSGKIKGLDCISVGPDMYDIHTYNERLSISSCDRIYELLITVLKNLK